MIATAHLQHLRRPLIGGAFALAASSALLYWTHTGFCRFYFYSINRN